jgi:hypothetical protein
LAGAVQISEIGADDLEALARFLAREGGSGASEAAMGLRDARHYHWFLLENPAQPAGVPCGWIARDAAGEVVGSKFCAAEHFRCAGQTRTLLMGGGFYVSSAHRGLGLSLMRRYLEQGRQHALYASTMNEVSGAFYEHYGGYPVPHTDHEWLGVLHYGPVVEEFLVRRFGRPGLARWLARASALRPASVRGASRGELVRVASSAELSQLEIAPPPEHATDITALRDEAFLRWRYFEGPDASRALFVYRSERGARWWAWLNVRLCGVTTDSERGTIVRSEGSRTVALMSWLSSTYRRSKSTAKDAFFATRGPATFALHSRRWYGGLFWENGFRVFRLSSLNRYDVSARRVSVRPST